MKTTLFILGLIASSMAFSQTMMPTGPQPPVPHGQDTMKETTGGAIENPNEEITKGSEHGSIKVAKIYFLEPQEGATVGKTVTVKGAVEGMTLRPAGEAPDEVTSGHLHVIIDGKSESKGKVLGQTEKIIHLSKGETETTLNLKPGKHTLTLQFADGAHRSFGPKFSQTIHITVK